MCSVTQRRRSRGDVRIVDVDVNGSNIVIENITLDRNTKQLSGWTLMCNKNGGPDVTYSFGNYMLKPGVKLKIYAQGFNPSPGDMINCEYIVNDNITSWGTGSGTAVLFDDNMTEKASLSRTVSYHKNGKEAIYSMILPENMFS